MARSKEFDENEVLNKAMRLFWEQGYEKTSMQELVEHMGIHRRSLYDTFGDKHSLFMQALSRYDTLSSTYMQNTARQSGSYAQAIRSLFSYTLDGDESQPKGCMFVNTAVELGPRDPVAVERTLNGFTRTEQLLAELIRQGQQSGEFAAGLDPEQIAESLHNTWVGLRVMARTSATKEKLWRIAESAMAVLEK